VSEAGELASLRKGRAIAPRSTHARNASPQHSIAHQKQLGLRRSHRFDQNAGRNGRRMGLSTASTNEISGRRERRDLD